MSPIVRLACSMSKSQPITMGFLYKSPISDRLGFGIGLRGGVKEKICPLCRDEESSFHVYKIVLRRRIGQCSY